MTRFKLASRLALLAICAPLVMNAPTHAGAGRRDTPASPPTAIDNLDACNLAALPGESAELVRAGRLTEWSPGGSTPAGALTVSKLPARSAAEGDTAASSRPSFQSLFACHAQLLI